MKVPPNAVLTMHGEVSAWSDACHMCGTVAALTAQWCTGCPSRGFSGAGRLVNVSCPGCGYDGQYLKDAAGVRRGDSDE